MSDKIINPENAYPMLQTLFGVHKSIQTKDLAMMLFGSHTQKSQDKVHILMQYAFSKGLKTIREDKGYSLIPEVKKFVYRYALLWYTETNGIGGIHALKGR